MKINAMQVAAAGAIAGLLAVGGISLAAAQDAPGTTVPAPPTTPAPQPAPQPAPGQPAPTPGQGQAPPADDPNCPNMGGAGGTGTASNTGAHGPRGHGHGPKAAPQGTASAAV